MGTATKSVEINPKPASCPPKTLFLIRRYADTIMQKGSTGMDLRLDKPFQLGSADPSTLRQTLYELAQKEKASSARKLELIAVHGNHGASGEAINVLYMMLNSPVQSINRMGSEGFARIISSCNSAAARSCMSRLSSLIFADCSILRPDQCADPERKRKALHAIGAINSSRIVAAATLVKLMEHGDCAISRRIVKIANAALRSKSPDVIRIGEEVASMIQNSGNPSVKGYASSINNQGATGS